MALERSPNRDSSLKSSRRICYNFHNNWQQLKPILRTGDEKESI